MLSGEHVPQVDRDRPLREAIRILNEENIGAVLIMDDDQRVSGILTDGDIRRLVSRSVDFDTVELVEVMTPNPKCIEGHLLAADALSLMQKYEVTILTVINSAGQLIGIRGTPADAGSTESVKTLTGVAATPTLNG